MGKPLWLLCLVKEFMTHILSHSHHNLQCIKRRFYVIDQHKQTYNYEADRKEIMVFNDFYLFFLQITILKCDLLMQYVAC